MLDYRTQACFVCPSILQKGLQALAGRDAAKDVVFDRLEDVGECARVIASYAVKTGAEEVRLAQLGSHIWIRLEGEGRAGLNLVLRSRGEDGNETLSAGAGYGGVKSWRDVPITLQGARRGQDRRNARGR